MTHWSDIEDETLRIYWVKTYEYWNKIVYDFAKRNNLSMKMSKEDLDIRCVVTFKKNTWLEALEEHQAIPMLEEQLERVSFYLESEYKNLETHLEIYLITSPDGKMKNVETQVQYRLYKKENKK